MTVLVHLKLIILKVLLVLLTISSNTANNCNTFSEIVNCLLHDLHSFGRNGLAMDILIVSDSEYQLGSQPAIQISSISHLYYLSQKYIKTDSETFWVIQFTTNLTINLEILRKIAPIRVNKVFWRNNQWKPHILIITPENSADSHIALKKVGESQILAFNLHTKVYLLERNSNYNNSSCFNISIWELYGIKQELVFEKIGCYIDLKEIFSRVSKRADFRRIYINSAAVDNSDSVLEHSVKDINNKVIFETGFAVSLLNDLKSMLNFRVNGSRGEWLSKWPNGTLKGNSSKRLLNGDLDIHISHTTLLPYRAVYLNFLQPTMDGGIAVFLTQPDASTFRDVYLTPFHKYVWSALALTFFCLSCSMSLSYWIIFKFNNFTLKEGVWKVESFLWGLGALTQQGWYHGPNSISLKVIMVVGAATGLLVYIAYSAVIISLLSAEVIPIRTFADLLGYDLTIYADNGSTTITGLVEQLKINENIEVKSLMSRADAAPKLYNEHPCVFLSLTLFFTRTLRLNRISDSWICANLYTMKVNKAPTLSAMVVPKDSQFNEFFNYKIMQLKEIGLNHRYVELYESGISTTCLRKSRRHKQQMGFQDVYTAYLVLFFGFGLSVANLILERCIFYTLIN